MQTGSLASPQGGPRPGTVMYSAPPGGPIYAPQSVGQQPVSIRLSNYSGDSQTFSHVSILRQVTPIRISFKLPRFMLSWDGLALVGAGSLRRLCSLSGCNPTVCSGWRLLCV